MPSNSYWKKRAARRMYEYQADADKVANDISKAYIESTNYINEQIENVFRNFSVKNGLDEAEAKKLLKDLPDNATLEDLKKRLSRITDEEVKKEFISIIDSPAYAHRIGRFEQLQSEIDKYTEKLASFEQIITKKHYTALAKDAYLKNIFELQRGTGIAFSFSDIPENKIEQLLKSKWSSKNFSKRIWDRRKNINQTLREELLTGFLTGRSYNKTAKAVEERMASGAMEARRLVRTESAYIEENAELESYKECGIEKLRFVATLDMRTSEICAAYDGEIIEVDKAVSGVNIPPLHPWCRSTTIAVFDDDITSKLKRRAKDPETGEDMFVRADITYSEWKNFLTVDKNDGIIKVESGIAMRIDKFTPCLEDAETGQILQTSFSLVSKAELKNLKGWKFNWNDSRLANSDIYKLTLKDDKEIQGLVSVSKVERDRAMYINIVESAPHNLGVGKKYNGVGGHLYAIAAQKSVEYGFGGFLFMDAKNMELVEHYKKTLGAILIGRPHPYRMIIDEEAAGRLLEIYTLEGE